MRALFALLPVAALAACNPYNPDLGSTPFKCGTMSPQCPGGYECVSGLCEEMEGGGPDAPVGGDGEACADLAEPNDMITMATNGAVFDQLQIIMLEGLSLCPNMDTDYFHINQPNNCGTSTPCPNLDVTVNFEDLATPPTLVIQNATGVTITPGTSTGSGVLKATINNVAQGQYYVRVTAQAILSHYTLTIDGTRQF